MSNRIFYTFVLQFTRFFPAIFMSGLIFYLSSISGLKVSDEWHKDFAYRKILHVIFYFTLTLTYIWAYKNMKDFPTGIKTIIKRFSGIKFFSYLYVFILVFLFAISDEVHQYLVVARSGKVVDVFIDMLGAIIAFYLSWRFSAYYKS